MPSSKFLTIPYVLEIVTQLQPRTILDIGIGYGKYGVLFREYLDIWRVDTPYNDWEVKIIGIEAFEKYRNPVWEVYDKVLIGDVRSHLIELKKTSFDLLFMGDVIEHFTKDEGKRILNEIVYENAIIVTPYEVCKQGVVYGNSYEEHKSSWSLTDFEGREGLHSMLIKEAGIARYENSTQNVQVITYGNRFTNNPP